MESAEERVNRSLDSEDREIQAEIEALDVVRRRMYEFVHNETTPRRIREFYARLQKELLAAFDMAFLAGKDVFKNYFTAGVSFTNNAAKLVSLILPSSYKTIFDILQSSTSLLKDVVIIYDLAQEGRNGYRYKIQSRATRILLSEMLAERITHEYSDILQHVSESSHATLVNSLISRIDLRNALPANTPFSVNFETELLDSDVINLRTTQEFVPQNQRPSITSDDVFARPLIVYETAAGNRTFYKPMKLKNNMTLSCLGFRAVKDVSMLQDHTKFTVIQPLVQLIANRNGKEKADFANSMFLEIVLCESLEQLNDLETIVTATTQASISNQLTAYLNKYHHQNLDTVREVAPFGEHQNVISSGYNNIIAYFGSSFAPNSLTNLKRAVNERRFILRQRAHDEELDRVENVEEDEELIVVFKEPDSDHQQRPGRARPPSPQFFGPNDNNATDESKSKKPKIEHKRDAAGTMPDNFFH